MFNFVKKEVARLEVAQSEFGFVASLFQFFQGRATTFAIIFTICGLILAFRGKLTADYALLVTAIQGMVFAHSIKEDYFNRRSQNTTTVDTSGSSQTTQSTKVSETPTNQS
jgi:hypothetical protein